MLTITVDPVLFSLAVLILAVTAYFNWKWFGKE